MDQDLIEKIKTLTRHIKIQPLQTTSSHEFVELFNKTYQRKIDQEYVTWRAFASEAKTTFFEAREGETLCGVFGIQIMDIYNVDQKLGFFVDWIIDEKHQKTGLVFRFLEEAEKYCLEQNMAAMYHLPNQNFGEIIKKLSDWETTEVTTLEASPSSEINITEPFKEVSLADGNDLATIQKILESPTAPDYFRAKTPWPTFDWRFIKHPWYRYKAIFNESCFAVTKIFTDPTTKESFGDLIDIEADLQNKDQLEELALNVIEYFKKQGVKTITTWALPHTPLYAVMHSLGFKETQKKRCFCVKILDQKYKKLYDFSRWHLTQSDSEIY